MSWASSLVLYDVNADYNAAKNIAVRYCGYIHRGQKSRVGWPASQVSLKSGTLSVNGDYTPTELLGENGSPLTSLGARPRGS
jgi:hypothetical protein